MKKRRYLFLVVVSLVILGSCKLMAKAAAKHWSKKQINEFITNCETNAGPLLGEDNAKEYCECAVDVVAEQYTDYEDVKKVSIREILRIAKDCK